LGSPPWPGGPAPIVPSAWRAWGRNLALFVATAASVFLVGGLRSLEPIAIDVSAGARLAAGLLTILLTHEMGHYLVARRYGVDVTLPYFIPFPLGLVGTLGAFIRIRSRIPHRRALFDIGVAGPLAGFVMCLPVLWLGMREAVVRPSDPDASGLFLGEPLLFRAATWLAHGNAADDQTLLLGPLGLAAWFGLLVTALNLMPIGQLDGGHVTYSLFRKRAHTISRIASWLCVALVYFSPSWILWAILMRVLGRPHPPTLHDEAPLGTTRVLVGVLSLVVFLVCFTPEPIKIPWREVLAGSPLERFFP
jgi:membrane-associated protease RseP (regulator of RpoE activity)